MHSIHLLKYVLALPIGLLFTFFYYLLRWTVRTESVNATVPTNAITFFSHPQVYAMAMSPQIKKGGAAHSYVLGFHGFVPYVWTVLDDLVGIQYFLFDPQGAIPPYKQILQFLKNNPSKRMSIATDSGGPYGKVRHSLLKMALDSDRPLVGMGGTFSIRFTCFQHHLPLPGAKIKFRVSETISASDLRAMGEERALEKLQAILDYLIKC